MPGRSENSQGWLKNTLRALAGIGFGRGRLGIFLVIVTIVEIYRAGILGAYAVVGAGIGILAGVLLYRSHD